MKMSIKKHIPQALFGTSFNRGVFGYFIFGNSFAIFLSAALIRLTKFLLEPQALNQGTNVFRIIVISALILYMSISLIILFNTLRKTKSIIRQASVYSLLALFLIYAGIDYAKHKGLYTTEITINGTIQPSTFIQFKDLIDRSTVKPKRLIINSPGGNAEAGIAIGMLIHTLNIDVEVLDLCASSCANYIFTSGNGKFLNERSIVMFHGGMQQKNLKESIISHFNLEEKINNVEPTNKEGVITPTSEEDETNLSTVKSYIGLAQELSPEEYYAELDEIENKFFQERGIDRKILTYGQMGEYEKIYHAKKHFGFYYSIESMIEMGIKEIYLVDKKWTPELNPNISDFYKVEIKLGGDKHGGN